MPQRHPPPQHTRQLVLDGGPEGLRIDEQRNDDQKQNDKGDNPERYLYPAFMHAGFLSAPGRNCIAAQTYPTIPTLAPPQRLLRRQLRLPDTAPCGSNWSP